MFALQIELGVYGVVVALFAIFVGVPMLALVYLVARWGRLGTQLSLLSRCLGMSKPLGLTVAVVMLTGFLLPFLLGGDPPDEGLGEWGFALGMLLFLGGVFVAGWALARRDHLRFVRETPTTETGATLNPGDLVEVEGEAAPLDGTVTAPVSGTESLASRYRVAERRFGGRHRTWVPVDHGRGGVPFVVDDGSGPVVVDPEGARLDLERSLMTTVDGDEPLPDAAAGLVATIDGVDDDDRLRFVEWRLDPGETAYALGEAVDRPSADELGRTVVADGDGPFIVADRTEEALKRRLRWLVVYGGPGGAAAAVAGCGLMLWLAGAL